MKTSKSQQISPVMQGFARNIADARNRAFPKIVAEKAKHHVLDTIDAMVSGSRLHGR